MNIKKSDFQNNEISFISKCANRTIMKKIIIATLTILSYGCKAQNPIFEITDLENTTQDIYGAYHKDTQNLLNPFEGTCIYTSGNTSFKIVLQKKLMSSMSGRYYEDLLIGEYQYVVDGIEKVNTLSQLNINYPNQSNHSITGNLIITQGDIGCMECTAGLPPSIPAGYHTLMKQL